MSASAGFLSHLDSLKLYLEGVLEHRDALVRVEDLEV